MRFKPVLSHWLLCASGLASLSLFKGKCPRMNIRNIILNQPRLSLGHYPVHPNHPAHLLVDRVVE